MQRGSKMTKESREKISKAKKGKSISAQHKQNISIAKKSYWAGIKRLIAANREFNTLISAGTPIKEQTVGGIQHAMEIRR